MNKPAATITIEFEHDGQPMKAVYECASIPEVALTEIEERIRQIRAKA